MRGLKELLILGTVTGAIAACAPDSEESCEDLAKGNNHPENSEWLRLDSFLSRISLKYPPDWHLSTEAHDLGHDVLIKNTLDDFPPQIDIWSEELEGTSSSEAFRNIEESIRFSLIQNGNPQTESAIIISGGPCIDGSESKIFAYSDNSSGFQSSHYALVKDGVLFQFAFSARPDGFSENEEIFHKIIESVTFQEPSDPRF